MVKDGNHSPLRILNLINLDNITLFHINQDKNQASKISSPFLQLSAQALQTLIQKANSSSTWT
jgi:hypothetical protein